MLSVDIKGLQLALATKAGEHAEVIMPGFTHLQSAQPVTFGCTCSADRVRQSLSIYSAKDIATMTTEAGIVTADCQFCGAHYEFDPKTLGFEAEDE